MERRLVGQPLTISTTVTTKVGGVDTLTDPTLITLDLQKPDLTITTYTIASSPPVVRDSLGKFHIDLPGTLGAGPYQWEWATTGAGEGRTTGSLLLVDPFAFPDPEIWRPTRAQVAKYIPERTLPADQLSDAPLGDFTAATTPTLEQAEDHITDAAAWVALRTGTLDPSMYADASAVVAIRAAGMIELSMPVRDSDINTAEALLAQADAMVERLVVANEGANPGTSAPGLLSAWIEPTAVAWGDTLIW